MNETAKEWSEHLLYRVATAANERLSAYWRPQPAQLQLWLTLQDCIARDVRTLPAFEDAGFRVYSQFDEDGLLLYVLALIGMGSRRCVDIGCGKPMGSNSTNLIVNWAWRGLGIDGDQANVRAARRWYARNRSTMFDPPQIRSATVTPDNVNALLSDNGFGEDVDVISIDIDGLDYWIWEALEVRPRVVVIEFNNKLTADRAITVPVREPITEPSDLRAGFSGASLAALEELGGEKEYRFVGVSAGVNAFFVLESLIPTDALPPGSVEDALARPNRAGRRPVQIDEALLGRAWVDV